MTRLSIQHNLFERRWIARQIIFLETYANHFIGSASLLSILLSLLLFWPVEYVGYDTDASENVIVAIRPDSAAEHAGLKLGDRIVMLYERPVVDVLMSIRLVDAIGARPVPIIVERSGTHIALSIPRQLPALSFQLTKLALFVLALECWITGYVLGFVRPHTIIGSGLVVTFWFCMASVIGSLMFTQYVAYPIYAGLLWFIIAVLAPLGTYVHLWFPPRRIDDYLTRWSGAYLCSAIVVINAVLIICVAVGKFSLVAMVDLLTLVAPGSVVCSLLGSGLLLRHGFHATPVVHIRRQIRLISVTCASVTLLWLLAFIAPLFMHGAFIHGNFLILLFGAVPLAYLIGGRVRDLYQLDRLMTRGFIHLIVTSFLGTILMLSSRELGLSTSATGFIVAAAFVALYRPAHQMTLSLVPASFRAKQPWAIDGTFQQLTTTLESSELIRIVINGVGSNFGRPTMAFYIGDVNGTNNLKLVHQDQIRDIPEMLDSGHLTNALCSCAPVVDSRTLQHTIHSHNLSHDEQQLVLNPSIALWCSIRHAQGYLLGLVLLGMRSDLDQYRGEDIGVLRRLVEAASLAFTNSAAYVQQLANEDEIRMLFQQLQQAQDTAATELARWLHDEVINIPARNNIRSLKQLSRQVQDPAAHELITATLQREQELIYMLRSVSDRLHPLGIDDPLGLPIVLEMEAERQNQAWEGRCSVDVLGVPGKVAPPVQHEAFRITREAITNAIKHADATTVCIQLRYPEVGEDLIRLTISDNGRNAGSMESHASHRGLRYMRESARSAGGELSIQVQPKVSTTIVFSFPIDKEAGISEDF